MLSCQIPSDEYPTEVQVDCDVWPLQKLDEKVEGTSINNLRKNHLR